eukprot:3933910-Rhodomonas_salina.1
MPARTQPNSAEKDVAGSDGREGGREPESGTDLGDSVDELDLDGVEGGPNHSESRADVAGELARGCIAVQRW